MPNEYISNQKWDALQQAIAVALPPEGGDPAARAALLLADAGLCFEGMRGDFPEPDAVTIKVDGLTVRTEIEVPGDHPPEIFEARIRMAADMAVAKVLRAYWDNKDGNGEAA